MPQVKNKGLRITSMLIGESIREYIARDKGLASAVKYHGIIVIKEICRLIRTGLFLIFVRKGYAFRMEYNLAELEHALFNVEQLKKQHETTDGHVLWLLALSLKPPGRAR